MIKNLVLGWGLPMIFLSPLLIMNIYEFRANNLAGFIGAVAMLVSIMTVKYRVLMIDQAKGGRDERSKKQDINQ